MAKKMNISVTKGITQNVDNYALQKVLMALEKTKIKLDELLRMQLNKCEFSQKQAVTIYNDDESVKESIECFFCEKPINESLIVYHYENDEIVICLESEAEELIK